MLLQLGDWAACLPVLARILRRDARHPLRAAATRLPVRMRARSVSRSSQNMHHMLNGTSEKLLKIMQTEPSASFFLIDVENVEEGIFGNKKCRDTKSTRLGITMLGLSLESGSGDRVEMGEDAREQLLQPRFRRRARPEAAPAAAEESGVLRTVSIPEATWSAVLRATLALLAAPAKGGGLPPACQQLALVLAPQALSISAGDGLLPGADAAQKVSSTAAGSHAPSNGGVAKEGTKQAGALENVHAASASAAPESAGATVLAGKEAGAAAAEEPGSVGAAAAGNAANGAKQAPPKKDIPAPSRVSRRLEAQRWACYQAVHDGVALRACMRACPLGILIASVCTSIISANAATGGAMKRMAQRLQ